MTGKEYKYLKARSQAGPVLQKNPVRLNLNESSLDLPLSLKNKIWRRLKNLSWNRYPEEENQELLTALANYCHQPAENILPGNGSNELIEALIKSIAPDGLIIIFRPSFSIYSRQLRVTGKNFVEIKLDLDKGYAAGTWLDEKIPSADLIFIDCPNNPVGCVISSELLKEILNRAKGLVVVDEAYAEFSEFSYISWVQQYDNLAVLRTLSKAFRLAGARFGYLISAKSNIDRIKKARLPFSVGIFPQAAALVAINEREFILKQVKKIKKERERVFNCLSKLSQFKPLPSRANFLLVQSKRLSAREVSSKLQAMGVLVRIFDLPELKNYFRVTIGSRPENDIFLESIYSLERESQNATRG
ncbi:MAG: histidinol-phosphate transaminase [Candidatus Saccharicenans sp.]